MREAPSPFSTRCFIPAFPPKERSVRKLQLTRETLLRLSDDQLERAVGGDLGGDGTDQGLTSLNKPPVTYTCITCPSGTGCHVQ